MKRIIKGINIILAGGLIITALAVAFIALPFFGNQALIVRSGSMVPTIDIGSIVVVRTQKYQVTSPTFALAQYQVGDVIAFHLEKTSKTIVTHRIVGIEQGADGIFYQTKGDANNTVDGWSIDQQNVLGKVYFWIPYAGQVLAFAKSGLGLALLIVIPAVLVILMEFFAILHEVRKKKHHVHEPAAEHRAKSPFHFAGLKIIIPIVVAVGLAIPVTYAFMKDTEKSSDNTFAAAAVFPTASASATPTFTPTPTATSSGN